MFKTLAKDKLFWRKVREDISYKPLIERLMTLYDSYCKKDVIPSLKYTDYKLYFETGDRNTYEKSYFSKRIRLNTLAILALIYPEKCEYIEKLHDTIWAICDEYTWVVPAHLQKYPETEFDTVDLFSSETAFALAEIKYLLSERLDEHIKKRIDNEIKTKVLDAYLKKEQRWEKWENNWAAVCAASVGAAFMYVSPDKFESVKERLSLTMDCFLKGYKDDGACPVGLSYWEYGFGFYIWYADLLDDFTFGREKLLDNEKIQSIAAFAEKTYLTENVTLTFSDANPGASLMVGMCHFLKTIYGDHMVLPPTELRTDDHCGRWCHHIRSFVFFNPAFLNTEFKNAAEYHLPDTEWYIKRTKGYSFAIKGGHNDEPHNHNDIGTFIVAKGDEEIIADLGCGEYTKDYFHPDTRYGILCNSSLGHSVPVINGKGQKEGRQYKGSLTVCENEVTVNMKNAYDDDSLKKLERKIRFSEDGITLSDSFDFVPGGSYVSRFVTCIKPTEQSGKLFLKGAELIFDKEKWDVSITRDAHTSHIAHEKIKVYLIDFKPKEKQTLFELKLKIN